MKKHLIFLSFVVACNNSSIMGMNWFLSKMSNFSSVTDFSQDNFSSVPEKQDLQVKKEIVKKTDVVLMQEMSREYPLIIEKQQHKVGSEIICEEFIKVVEEVPSTYEIIKIGHKVIKAKQKRELCSALIKLYNTENEYVDDDMPFRRRLITIKWKIELYKNGENINLNLLALELSTAKKIYNEDITSKQEEDTKKLFRKIKNLNKK